MEDVCRFILFIGFQLTRPNNKAGVVASLLPPNGFSPVGNCWFKIWGGKGGGRMFFVMVGYEDGINHRSGLGGSFSSMVGGHKNG